MFISLNVIEANTHVSKVAIRKESVRCFEEKRVALSNSRQLDLVEISFYEEIPVIYSTDSYQTIMDLLNGVIPKVVSDDKFDAEETDMEHTYRRVIQRIYGKLGRQTLEYIADGKILPPLPLEEIMEGCGLTRKRQDREALLAGWESCRKTIYAVCEMMQDESQVELDKYSADQPDPKNYLRRTYDFYRGHKDAAKRLARYFNSIDADHDENWKKAEAIMLTPSNGADYNDGLGGLEGPEGKTPVDDPAMEG